MPAQFKFPKECIFAALSMMLALTARGAHPCARCHPEEVTGFLATPMARALERPKPEPPGTFIHSISHTHFTIETRNYRMVQRLERDGLAAQYDIAYAVGSGTHAFAYLIQIGDHLFQSPLGYFAGRGWGMSPGYENSPEPDFYRPVTADCLVCHSGHAQPVPGTFNSYQSPPFSAEGITCDRCHGPVEAHLRNPVPGSIINPAKLPPRARDSVCEQCHLSGEERIPNPGKMISDFRAGQELEDTYSVYVDESSREPSLPSSLRVVSQAQQLALSVCAMQSRGELWCGTCHDPHSQPAKPAAYFRARCLTCHATILDTHAKPVDDCIGCHMPRRPVTDGAHTIFTDHRIARHPAAEAGSAALPGGGAAPTLVAWHNPRGALAQRNLGLADLKIGQRLESFEHVQHGFQLLMDSLPDFPNDPAVLSGIGDALLTAGHFTEAAASFERAIQIEPNVAVHYLHAGLAWKAARERAKAVEYFEKTIQLDPLLEQPYLELAATYAEARDSAMVRRTNERYLKAFPKNLRAQRLNLP